MVDVHVPRVLVLLHSAKDVRLTAEVVASEGAAPVTCQSVGEVGREISLGADALIVSEEALEEDNAAYLQQALAAQPEWSSVPVLLMVADVPASPLATAVQEHSASVQVLTYPVALATFRSAIRSALGARRRQYQVRDLLADLAQREEVLRESEERYRTLFDSIDEGFCVIEVVFDEADRPIDYRFLEVNAAFERQTDIKNAVGRRMREIAPEHEKHWFEIFGRIAETGEAVRFENPALALGRHYDVYAFRAGDPAQRRVGVLFIDITVRKEAEEALLESEEKYRALAEENERLYRRQLRVAADLQSSLLYIPSELGPLRLSHLYRSATEAARMGGDFYDAFEMRGGKIAVLIGDVAGHGIEAVGTAILVKDVIQAFGHQTHRPELILGRTNRLLIEKNLPGFVTLFLGILDAGTGDFRYCSAGHPATLLRRSSGEVEPLGSGSYPLGVFAEASWRPQETSIGVGDLLLLYTDGIIEARQEGEFFGEERLEVLLAKKASSMEDLPGLVLNEVLDFSGGPLEDDLALLALQVVELPKGATRWKRFRQEKLLG